MAYSKYTFWGLNQKFLGIKKKYFFSKALGKLLGAVQT